MSIVSTMLEISNFVQLIIPDVISFAEPIIDFDWEPNGSKFVVIHGESPRISVSFYDIEEGSLGKVVLLSKLIMKALLTCFLSRL